MNSLTIGRENLRSSLLYQAEGKDYDMLESSVRVRRFHGISQLADTVSETCRSAEILSRSNDARSLCSQGPSDSTLKRLIESNGF